MKKYAPFFLLPFVFVTSAHAGAPCERGTSAVIIGGVDSDLARCKEWIAQRHEGDLIGQLSSQLEAALADDALTHEDLKAARARADDLQKQLDDLKRGALLPEASPKPPSSPHGQPHAAPK